MAAQIDSGAAEPIDIEQISRLAAAANAGDRAAIAELRHILDSDERIWRVVADLVSRTESLLIEQASGGEELLAESLRRKLAAMKLELIGNTPSPLEQLLVDRICACWLHVQLAEIALATADKESRSRQCRGILKTANQTYLNAIRLLAHVRGTEADRSYGVSPRSC